MAEPRAAAELKKAAQQKLEAYAEEKKLYEKTKAKELEIATQWELMRQLCVKERVTIGKDLQKGLEAVRTAARAENMPLGMCKKQELDYLKKQRQFLFLLGVSAKKAPLLTYTTAAGKRMDFTPSQFCEALGKVVDAFERKDTELCNDLKPIEPLTKKLDEFATFRGGTVTAFMQQYLDTERKRLNDMVDQVKKDVEAGIATITAARTQKNSNKKNAKQDAWLKKGAKVWVADEDDLDPEADQRVWEAKVVEKAPDRKVDGKVTKGWWSLSFGEVEGNYDYICHNIFQTELDAKLNLLV